MDIIPSVIDRLEKSYINAFKLGASNGNPGKLKTNFTMKSLDAYISLQ